MLLLIILTTSTSFSQYVLKGTVTNVHGDPLPGARIYRENTSYGVISDYNGEYFLEFKSAGEYTIHFQMLSYKDTIIVVPIKNKFTSLNVVLNEKLVELNAVEVIGEKSNLAHKVIKNVQQNRKNFVNQYENFTCTTYLKTGLSQKKRKPEDSDTLDNGPVRMSLTESVSISTFISPDFYHEKIIAHHDYSDKEINRSEPFLDYYMDDVITPVQSVQTDPYIFYEKISDGDFNLYQNMLDLPKISEYPITSPVGLQAFTNYKFKLADIFEEDGKKIYEIEVIPRFKRAPLLSGSLYIIDSLWVIKSFNLSMNPGTMHFFKEFTVIQDYEEINGLWVPVRREFIYTIREGENYITADTRVNHANYQFNSDVRQKQFKNEIAGYAEDAFSKDSAFWSENRPIQLKKEELEFIYEQIRIDSIQQSQHYLDSIDAQFNKITFGDVFLYGIGKRNRYKQTMWYFDPLLSHLEFFGVGGFRYGLGGFYSKKFENAHKIKISPDINFNFRDIDPRGSLGIEYTFLPMKFGNVEVIGGSNYELVTQQLSGANWLMSGPNSVLNEFFSISHRRELVNGLYGRVKFSFSDRKSIENKSFGPIIDYFQSSDTVVNYLNDPIVFERYKVAMIEFKIQYRFKQQYIIKKNEKLIVGTEYPELEFSFRQGIPALFGSEVRFNNIELKISDEMTLGNFGLSKWKLIGGSFLNTTDLRVIEYKFIKQSDIGYFSNPLFTHQLLDSTYTTTGAYAQGFYIHHFNGTVMNKIPLLNRSKLELVGGMSFLYLDEANLFHTEFFVGVERKFRAFKEVFKYGIYYCSNFDNNSSPYFKFKIGFDYFNTFTNKWNY